MEYLKHYDDEKFNKNKKVKRKMYKFVDYVENYYGFLDGMRNNRLNDKQIKKYRKDYNQPVLNKIIETANNVSVKYKHSLDLHYHNVMIRGNKTLVITDPIC